MSIFFGFYAFIYKDTPNREIYSKFLNLVLISTIKMIISQFMLMSIVLINTIEGEIIVVAKIKRFA